jgi:hypothetical protein
MAEQKQRDIENDDSRSGALTDRVEHWVEITDEWVAHLDSGMGGTAPKGADPAEACQPPDPLPGPALGTG